MLTSKTEIKQYLRNTTDYMFKEYVKAGMPARYDKGRWSGSAEEIGNWWRVYNRVSAAKIIDNIPDNGDG